MRRHEIGRRNDRSIPITSQHRKVDAYGVNDVHQVIGDGRDAHGFLSEEAPFVHHADRATGVGDGFKLLVREVSPMRVDGVDSGMRDEGGERRVVHLERVKKGAPPDMREIDKDLLRIELADIFAAKIGESIGRARKTKG